MIQEFCDWLSKTNISVAFQSATWFVPTVQTVHIISIAILLTSVYVMSFRLIGVTRARPTAGGSGCQIDSLGLDNPLRAAGYGHSPHHHRAGARAAQLGFSRENADGYRTRRNFAASCRFAQRRSPEYWTESPTRRLAARAIGIAAVIIGAGIVTAGRWIAYV